MTATLIYCDLIEEQPMELNEFRVHSIDAGATWPVRDLEVEYAKYLEAFQPWRILVLSADNHEALFRSTERYFNEADARHAAEIAFGTNSNVYLRQAEHGNVQLRLATK
jgi:hypothetical protein